MSTQDKNEGDSISSLSNRSRPVRNKTLTVKALETALLEKTNSFWKCQKDLETNTNKLVRADPFSKEIPKLREMLQSSLETFDKIVRELKILYSQDKGNHSEQEVVLAVAKKWYDIATGVLTSSSLQIIMNEDSRSQVSSTTSSARRLEARAKLAEEQARFEYEELIRRKNAELEQKKLEMEEELNKLKSQRDLKMAEASAKVYDTEEFQFPNFPMPNPPDDQTARTQKWLDNNVGPKFSSRQDTGYHEYTPKLENRGNIPPWTQQPEKFAGNYPLFKPSTQYPYEHHNNVFLQSYMDMQHETNKKLVSSLAKQSLPKCEPDVFYGDAALFLPWKMSFRAMINDVDATPEQELTYLLRYTAGKPNELVNTYRRRVHPDVQTKVDSLWECLQERFGHSAEITNSLLENLQKAARFKHDDREAFQHFYDVCEDVNSQIPYLKGLSILNSSYYMKTLVDKVPKIIRDKWESRITKYMVGSKIDDYPPFHMFVEVIHNISVKRNHPAIIRVAGADYEHSPSTLRYKPATGSCRKECTRTLRTEVKLNSFSHKGESEEEVAKCPLHPEARKTHTLAECRLFVEKPVAEREKIVNDAKICFRCLTRKHFSKFCKADIKCSTCGRRHNTLLHKCQDSESSTLDTLASSHSGEKVESSCTLICGNQSVSGKSCGKIVLAEVFDRNNSNLRFRSYVNLDDQSNHTLGTGLLMNSLQVAGDNQPYILETCHGKKVCSGRRGLNLAVRSLDGRVFNLPTVIESENIPEDKDEIPTPDVIAKIPHLSSIARYIPPLEESTGIHLLIGRDAPELLKVREFINGSNGEPWAQRLDLGWTVSGELCLDRQGGRVHVKSRRTGIREDHAFEQCQNKIKCREIFTFGHIAHQQCTSLRTDTADQSTLEKVAHNVFLTTEKDSELGSSPEDRKFLQCMETNFHMNDGGNWEAPLPFRNPHVTMPDNYVQAEKRFKILKRNFERNDQLQKDYFEFMNKIIQKGHASRIPESELVTKPGKKWYLPHFAVYHPQKMKIRVVFDSSAEYGGTSLNQELLQGPDLMNKLFGRLLRFRQHNVGIMCDIEQMFHSFHVNREHRDFLRFLWFAEEKSLSTAEYRMNVHLFGNGPSPAIATFGLRKAADYLPKKYSEDVRKFIKEDFYVDDGVYSCKSSDEAINLLKSAQEMLMESKLRLHKIVSNNSDVMEAFSQEDLANSLTNLDLSVDEMPSQRTLGVQWDLAKDVFTFKVITKEKPYTRRGVLSVINSIYDPFGFLAPFTIIGKMILQKLIQLGNAKGNPLSWDDSLPSDLEAEWYNWYDGLQSLQQIQVNRCLHPQDFGCITRSEVHAFSDASKEALGVVIYLRLFDTNGRIYVSFVRGSAKVKPHKHLSIPRMELCAAVLLATTVKQTLTELEYAIDNIQYYTDSRVVLGYIMNESRRFYVYVANRIELIRSITSPTSWKYVESENNPADIATRGCTVSKLTITNWYSGPQFLSHGEDLPFESFEPDDDDQELRSVKSCATKVTKNQETTCSLCDYFSYFSSWSRLLRSIARLKLSLRKKTQNTTLEDVDSNMLLDAEMTILKHVQHESFEAEIKVLQEPSSSRSKRQLRGLRLHNLDVFLHEDVIRVGGRLRQSELSFPEKHPVVLPKNDHVTRLLSQHIHEKNHHQGRSITHGAIRLAGFWIVGGTGVVNNLIRNCIRCKLLRQPTETPKMANLPEDRLCQTPPFTNVGMDAFGPWEIATRRTRGGSINSKRWGIIFTCLYSRAIHIEVVDSMDTSAFINALRRLFAIRGPVSILRSDCGTNFVGARNELQKALSDVNNDVVKKFLLERECKWLWNPPHASHFGGVWERQIGTVRRVLDGMLLQLGRSQLDHDLLVTLMAEATAIVNSRPLTAVPSDSSSDPMPLSPANILTMKTRPYSTPSGTFDSPDLYCRRRWRRVQYLADQFWLRWRREYLQEQQKRRKWTKSTPNLAVNDIVLIHDKNIIRGSWPRGRVTAVKASSDGIVRQAEVEVYEDDLPGTTYSRSCPSAHLCFETTFNERPP